MKIMKKRSSSHRSLAVFLLLGLWLVSSSAAAAGNDKNNVVIVLDASGSMGETMRGTGVRKIDAAKKALKEVIKHVPADTQIGILVFSASNLSNDWVYPLGPRDDAKLMRAIDKPEPGGRTPLGQYTKVGADALLRQRKAQYGYGSYRLLVVTDGEAGDPELVDKYVPESMARGIVIDAIGVDMRSDHTLATKVNSYRRANDPRALKTAVAEVFAEVADSGSNATSQDAFDQLASIPDELATGMLKALTASGNHPIGEKPKPAPVEDSTQSDNGDTKPSAEDLDHVDQEKKSDGMSTKMIIFLVGAVFFVVILIKKFSKKR